MPGTKQQSNKQRPDDDHHDAGPDDDDDDDERRNRGMSDQSKVMRQYTRALRAPPLNLITSALTLMHLDREVKVKSLVDHHIF